MKALALLFLLAAPAFAADEGVYLTGPQNQTAFSTLRDYGKGDVPEPEIIFDENGAPFVSTTRFLVVLKPKASVGQVNAALKSVGGRITSMKRGKNLLEIRIPDPHRARGLSEVESLAKDLRKLPPFQDALPLSFQ